MATNFTIPQTIAALTLLLWCAPFARAGDGEALKSRLSPAVVFVGDNAALITTLGPEFVRAAPFVSEGGLLPQAQDKDIRLTRVELERRGSRAVLTVRFVPYRPGVLTLPPLTIPGEDSPLTVSGLNVTVASALNSPSQSLSGIAPPLLPPGALVLVFGAVACALALAALGVCASPLGQRRLAPLLAGPRRRWFIRNMERELNRAVADIRQNCAEEQEQGELLAALVEKFRGLLTRCTGVNCAALAAGEFARLPENLPASFAGFSALFARWDALRFNGSGISGGDIIDSAETARKFLKQVRERGKKKVAGAETQRACPETRPPRRLSIPFLSPPQKTALTETEPPGLRENQVVEEAEPQNVRGV